tara:strand:- start:126 stop:653 length:528 start_codon:yes stop_codon:yes gene_type:complete
MTKTTKATKATKEATELQELKKQMEEMKQLLKQKEDENKELKEKDKTYYETTQDEDGNYICKDPDYIRNHYNSMKKEDLVELLVKSNTNGFKSKDKESFEKKSGSTAGKRGKGYYTKTENGQLLVSSGNIRPQVKPEERCCAKTYCGLRCNTRKKGTARYCGQHLKVPSKFGDFE